MTDQTKDQAAAALKEVNNQLKALTEKVQPLAENALNEAKKANDLSAETKETVDKTLTDLNNLRQAQNDLQVKLGEAEQLFARGGTGNPGAQVDARAGDLAVKDEQIISFASNATSGKRISVAVPRNALTSFAVNPVDGSTRIVTAPNQRVTIRDLLAPGQTASNAIAYLRETGFTNNAAPVAENTTKPYSELTFEEVLEGVKTIAHMLKASKQILDDLPQLQSFIGGVSKSMLKQSRLNFDKIEKCE